MSPLLTLRDLVVEHRHGEGWRPIVNGISLHVERGEVLGLIGESGAGKSTLGIASMGYTREGCRIASGSIVFDGRELTTASEEELRGLRGARVAYVAQSAAAAFNPALRLLRQTAEATVEHGVMPRAGAEREAVSLFRQLHLPEPERIGTRYPHQVSGGQLQRAMVAMAMACGARLVVFDEPTTALDVTTQIEVLATIQDAVRESGTAAIYISHDLAVVAQIADRIMVLRHGKMVEQGATREILSNPRETYTRALLSARHVRQEKAVSPDPDGPLLEIEGVSASYVKGVRVLEDVTVTVPRRQTVAVVGESGSGKSTLARVIVGLVPPVAGRILFKGEPLPQRFEARSKEMLRRIQIVYQSPDVALNPRQTVGEAIGRPLRFYFGMTGRERSERAQELLGMIELSERYVGRYPSELSGGEKQRVCIARALAASPELVLCDEVTSALDQLVAKDILLLLQRLQENLGIAYLFITHDLATVRALADTVVIMRHGKIVEQGTRDEVLTTPSDSYTRLLLSSAPEMRPDWLSSVLQARELHPSQSRNGSRS